jgi:hypothetical protein
MIGLLCNRRWRSVVLSAFMLWSLLGFQKTNASPLSQVTDQVHFDEGEHFKYAMLKYLVPVLLQPGKAGRIYYEADCPPDEPYPHNRYIFPKLDVQQPSKDVVGLAAVREIFRDDTNVEVDERTSGIIRIRIGNVPDEILKTTITLINVPPEVQYDSYSVIEAIENGEEVRAVMRKLNLRLNSGIFDGGFTRPAQGRPHLSNPLKNVTMDQALDAVAQTFGGIVLYGACTKEPYITIRFTGGPNFHPRSLPP